MARWVAGRPDKRRIFIYYLVLMTVILILKFKRNGKKYIISITLYTVGFLILISGPWVRTGAEVTMLDVGQGDCICVEGPEHKTYLIDGGSSDIKNVGKYRIEPFLKYRGIGSIDYVFVSHGDIDHMNGIEEMLKRQQVGIKIRNLVVTGEAYRDEKLEELISVAEDNGTTVWEMENGTQIREGKLRFTCLGPKEKNINLNVALKLGNMIKKNCDDVKVIYTRSKDVFIPLDRRAEIANSAKADLFISIHTNALANNRVAKGASTWTLGLAKSDANLAVAQRENSVILYESDYKTRYAGFNPNSAESYIIFEFMQDKYMEQSVHLASLVQKQFRHTCKRVDRGVHQAGFLVLKASAMPSILVELGFISTPEEERYLNTEAGTSTLAKGIYRAFLTYKREQEIRLTGASRTIIPEESTETPETVIAAVPKQENTKTNPTTKASPQRPITVESATNDGEITFKIQILTSSKPLAKNDKRLKGLTDIDYYKEGGLYKYTYGASSDYTKVLRSKRTITDKFKDAFIIAFRDGEKININAAIAEFKKKRNK